MCTVASTFPSFIGEPSSWSSAAAFAYSGASDLQWPHQGASEWNRRDYIYCTTNAITLTYKIQLAQTRSGQ